MFVHVHLSLLKLSLVWFGVIQAVSHSFQHASNRGNVCFGRGNKPPPAISGNNLNSRMPSMSDDFWSTSTCDLDEMLTLQSRQSSFISTTNHNHNHGGVTDNLSNHSDFVNHGKLRTHYPLFVGKQRHSFVCTRILHLVLISILLQVIQSGLN